MCSSARTRGFSLIEVVVFIVVIGIAVAGLAMLYNQVTRTSVDPLIRKQALAIATSLLEEVELQAYTVCDPDDAAVYTATTPPPAGCGTFEGIGIEGSETRYGPTRFDNVSDYHNFRMGAGVAPPNDSIQNIDGTPIDTLADYSVLVTVAAIAANELGATIPATEALYVTVTATHAPTGIAVQVQGYRIRYAPNSP